MQRKQALSGCNLFDLHSSLVKVLNVMLAINVGCLWELNALETYIER